MNLEKNERIGPPFHDRVFDSERAILPPGIRGIQEASRGRAQEGCTPCGIAGWAHSWFRLNRAKRDTVI